MQISNGLFVLREDLINAKSRSEGLSMELLEAKARESKALDDLRAVQEGSQSWRERAEKELKILDATLSEVRAKLLPTEEKLKGAVLQLEHTENRADSAEAAARDAAEKLALAEKDAKEALDRVAVMEAEALEKLAVAEAKAQEKIVAAETKAQEKIAASEMKAQREVAAAEARVQGAINEYKSSPDFASELHEAALDAFIQGFERGKRRLARHFKLGSLEHFRPEDDEESSDAEAENAGGGTVAVRDPATEASGTEEPVSESTAKSGHPENQ